MDAFSSETELGTNVDHYVACLGLAMTSLRGTICSHSWSIFRQQAKAIIETIKMFPRCMLFPANVSARLQSLTGRIGTDIDKAQPGETGSPSDASFSRVVSHRRLA